MSASSESSRTIMCKNLDRRVTPAILYELFLQAGPLVKVSRPIRRERDEELRRRHEGTTTTEKKRETPTAKTSVGEEGKDGKTRLFDEESSRDNVSDDISIVTLENDCKKDKKNIQSVRCVKEVPVDGQTVTSEVGIEEQTDSLVNRKSSRDLKEGVRNGNDTKDPDYQPFGFVIFCYSDAAEYAINLFKGTKLFGRSLNLKICSDDVATRVDGKNVRKREVTAGTIDGISSVPGRSGGAPQMRLHVDRVQHRYMNSPSGHNSCECLDYQDVRVMPRYGFLTYNSSRNNRFGEIVSSHYEQNQSGRRITYKEKAEKDNLSRNVSTLERNAKIADRINGSCKQTEACDFVKNGNANSFGDSSLKTTDPCTISCSLDTVTHAEQRGNGYHEKTHGRSRKNRNYNHEQHYQPDNAKGMESSGLVFYDALKQRKTRNGSNKNGIPVGPIQNGTVYLHTSTKSQGHVNISRPRKITGRGNEQEERRMTSELRKSPAWWTATEGVNDHEDNMDSRLRSSTDQTTFRDTRRSAGDEQPVAGTGNRSSGHKQNVPVHYKDEKRRSRKDIVNSNMEYVNSSYQPYQRELMSYALPPSAQRAYPHCESGAVPRDGRDVHGACAHRYQETRQPATSRARHFALGGAGLVSTPVW